MIPLLVLISLVVLFALVGAVAYIIVLRRKLRAEHVHAKRGWCLYAEASTDNARLRRRNESLDWSRQQAAIEKSKAHALVAFSSRSVEEALAAVADAHAVLAARMVEATP